jgi:hypothetical protein
VSPGEAALVERPYQDGVARPAGVGQVFGIDVDAPAIVSLAGPGGELVRGRRTKVRMTSAESLMEQWRPRNPTAFIRRRYADGRLSMTVDYDEDCGYLIYAPWYGRYLVSPDGRSVLSAMPNVPRWRWQIVLYAQALPLAATLQGLELLHASAVLLDGRLLAFSAPSGTGKTSVAAHLVAGGATLLTDDVLAVERRGKTILAYPGAPLTKVSATELAAIPRPARGRLGTRIGRNDKILLHAPVPEQPHALDSIYFLRRSPGIGRLAVEHVAADPLRLLGHSFNTYVRTRERIVNQLAVHAVLVESVRLFSVSIPPSVPAPEVARAVRAHAREAA